MSFPTVTNNNGVHSEILSYLEGVRSGALPGGAKVEAEIEALIKGASTQVEGTDKAPSTQEAKGAQSTAQDWDVYGPHPEARDYAYYFMGPGREDAPSAPASDSKPARNTPPDAAELQKAFGK